MSKIRSISVLLTLPVVLCLGTRGLAQETALPANAASAVSLDPGDCALFIWVGDPGRLLFISQADDGVAYAAGQAGKRYSISPGRTADKFGQYGTQDFLGERGQSWQVRLITPAERPSAVFYTSGTITIPAPDGWVRIESAQGVSACNDTDVGSALNLDETDGGFTPPAWVQPPSQLEERQRITAPSAMVEAVTESKPAPAAQIIEMPDPQPEQEPVPARQVIRTPQPPSAPLVMAKNVETPFIEKSSDVEKIPDVEQSAPAWINAGFVAAAPIPLAEADTAIPPLTPPLHTVQIGSYRTDALAHKAWNELQQEATYLQEKDSVVQRAFVKGQGEVFRLRVTGFSDRDGAVNFCWRLQSNGLDCYVPSVK